MKDKLNWFLNQLDRLDSHHYILRFIVGVDCKLLSQITPEEQDRYYMPYILRWRRTIKGRLLLGLWFLTLFLAIALLVNRYYLDGIVIFYGLIRLSALLVNTNAQDYLDEKKERNSGSK